MNMTRVVKEEKIGTNLFNLLGTLSKEPLVALKI